MKSENGRLLKQNLIVQRNMNSENLSLEEDQLVLLDEIGRLSQLPRSNSNSTASLLINLRFVDESNASLLLLVVEGFGDLPAYCYEKSGFKEYRFCKKKATEKGIQQYG